VTNPRSIGAAAAIAALQSALSAQHAAVYSYSIIGTLLTDPLLIKTAREVQNRHRQLRDADLAALAQHDTAANPPSSRYPRPAHATGTLAGVQWALQLEENCAAAYRYLLVTTATDDDQSLRSHALTGLYSAAETAVIWRSVLTPQARTVPFPGTTG
jgi:hypothetical protein